MVPACLDFVDIHHNRGSQGIPRGRQRPDGLNRALAAEITLRQIFFLTRGTERKPDQVLSRCNPVEGCGTLKLPLTGIVLRERSANENGRNNLGEGTNTFENMTNYAPRRDGY